MEPLPPSVAPAAVPLVPAQILKAFAYCPRLAYLLWVQDESGDGTDPMVETSQAMLLSSETLGAIAHVRLSEDLGGFVVPVAHVEGSAEKPDVAALDAERVSLCLQGLLLREAGYGCTAGVIRMGRTESPNDSGGTELDVGVAFDDGLIRRTMDLLDSLRRTAEEGKTPPPLEDSPKCLRCSLAGVCMPDEVALLVNGRVGRDDGAAHDVQGPRRLMPARDDAAPLYVQTQGAVVSKRGDRLEVHAGKETLGDVRLLDVSQLCVFGGVQVTTQALRALLQQDIPVCHFTQGGWFYGMSQGMGQKNVELRRLQYMRAEDASQSLALARAFVAAKIRNQRTMLRRNGNGINEHTLDRLTTLARSAVGVSAADSLLGIEGSAASVYFEHFGAMLKPREGPDVATFDFRGRNRRPPRDPVNALLSFAYALMVKEVTVILMAVGFDPYLGFYHRPRYGRPALALDLMEEFRPLIADSVVIGLVNNGEVTTGDFVQGGGGVALTAAGRRKLLEAYARRLDTLVTHPTFGYTMSYRRIIEIQARLLARCLMGEIPAYVGFVTR